MKKFFQTVVEVLWVASFAWPIWLPIVVIGVIVGVLLGAWLW